VQVNVSHGKAEQRGQSLLGIVRVTLVIQTQGNAPHGTAEHSTTEQRGKGFAPYQVALTYWAEKDLSLLTDRKGTS
jgi:hypothetical protein